MATPHEALPASDEAPRLLPGREAAPVLERATNGTVKKYRLTVMDRSKVVLKRIDDSDPARRDEALLLKPRIFAEERAMGKLKDAN